MGVMTASRFVFPHPLGMVRILNRGKKKDFTQTPQLDTQPRSTALKEQNA